jgi:hypothetical protein
MRKLTIIIPILGSVLILALILIPTPAERERTLEFKSLKRARQLCIACRDYARQHGGSFPASLDALFPTYLTDRSLLGSPLSPDQPAGYTFTPPGPGKTDSPDTIVIEDKFAPSIAHIRLVSYANGSAKPLPTP